MVQINFPKREITVKLVYYGPGLSGKTTNLEFVHKKAPEDKKGKLLSVAAGEDRTLFFDYMALDIGEVGGLRTRFQLYTVPGQVYYNSTRKLVLMGCDGVAFVADSQSDRMKDNLESLQNLHDNLKDHGLDITTIPLVVQFNKRDMPDALPLEELEAQLNKYDSPSFEATAALGKGVYPTLKKLIELVLARLKEKHAFLQG